MHTTRRSFLTRAGLASAAFLGLGVACRRGGLVETASSVRGFGPLVSDPGGVLDLPEGFTYRVLSAAGERMDDGLRVPGAHDGMAAFAGADGRVVLVRNHELIKGSRGPFDEAGAGAAVPQGRIYDPGAGDPVVGGTTTVVVGADGALERHFLSLVGTVRNCAGGPTPWGSWLTCEETLQRADAAFERDHGYVFEVPADPGGGLIEPVPLRDMGRFRHEAVAVDPATGVVYQTEDQTDGLLYRFVPKHRGELARGGQLQALALRDRPRARTGNHDGPAIAVGDRVAVNWVDVVSESSRDDLRAQGFAAGAAQFTRGEGMWWLDDGCVFTCTTGGARELGQIWRYTPAGDGGELELLLEPNDAGVLDHPDNITVSPWGDLVVCEDGSKTQFVLGVTPAGEVYRLARNAQSHSEFAGSTFSPDGSTLFVNIQNPGATLAITGPWERRRIG